VTRLRDAREASRPELGSEVEASEAEQYAKGSTWYEGVRWLGNRALPVPQQVVCLTA